MVMEKLPGFTGVKMPGEESDEDFKEFSIFNQAVFLFRRQDAYMKSFHELHYNAANEADLSGAKLRACYWCLRHALAPTKFAMPQGKVKTIEKNLAEIMNKITDGIANGKGALSKEDYVEIHDLLFVTFEKIYEANQDVNMGIPRERRYSEQGRIKQALK